MKIALLALLLCFTAAAGDTLIQPYCAHQLKALGFPVPPQTNDFIGVYSTGTEANAKYRVVLSYRVGSDPAISSTVDAVSNEVGIFAPFPVDEAQNVSVIGVSITKCPK